MSTEHQQLAAGRWQAMSLTEQLANVGAEVGRALKWKGKGNAEYSRLAFERALELLDLSVADEKNKLRLREVLRLREAMVDYFNSDNSFQQTAQSLNNYFYCFNLLSRARLYPFSNSREW